MCVGSWILALSLCQHGGGGAIRQASAPSPASAWHLPRMGTRLQLAAVMASISAADTRASCGTRSSVNNVSGSG